MEFGEGPMIIIENVFVNLVFGGLFMSRVLLFWLWCRRRTRIRIVKTN